MGLFHLVTRADWAQVEGRSEYAPPSLPSEGFIHFSEDRQLLSSAARYFSAAEALLVVPVREDELSAVLKYEAARGDLFRHLYGARILEAVIEVLPLPCEGDRFQLPQAWQSWRLFFEP